MSAVAVEARPEGKARRVPWVSWGNWYIAYSVTEAGWPSIYACLREYGEFQAATRILCREMPWELRRIDLAVGLLPSLLRQSIVLWYHCDRDARGRLIAPSQKALALEMPTSTYEEAVRVGKFMAERALNGIRRENIELAK